MTAIFRFAYQKLYKLNFGQFIFSPLLY